MPALKEIFDSNYGPLCNYANSIIKDFPSSEDIVQSIFIELWENKKIVELDNPISYLLRCVKYKCIDYKRKQKKELFVPTNELPEIGAQNQVLEFSEENIAEMFAFLTSQLTPKTRQVFLMRREQGLSYKEIADELNVSTKTVENQLSAARKKLKELLQKQQILPASLLIFENIFNSL